MGDADGRIRHTKPPRDECLERFSGEGRPRAAHAPAPSTRIGPPMPTTSSLADFGVSRTGRITPSRLGRRKRLEALSRPKLLGRNDSRREPAEQHHVADGEKKQDQDYR